MSQTSPIYERLIRDFPHETAMAHCHDAVSVMASQLKLMIGDAIASLQAEWSLDAMLVCEAKLAGAEALAEKLHALTQKLEH